MKQWCTQVLATMIALSIFALPSASAAMLSTTRVLSELSPERAQVSQFVQRDDVQTQLTRLGVSPAEAQSRLAALSDREIQKISAQLQSLPAGGDPIYIGVGVGTLIVVLLLLLLLR